MPSAAAPGSTWRPTPPSSSSAPTLLPGSTVSCVRFRSGLPTACSLKILPGLAWPQAVAHALPREGDHGRGQGDGRGGARRPAGLWRPGSVLREAAGADVAFLATRSVPMSLSGWQHTLIWLFEPSGWGYK
ncbi:uncharacterized protein LOC8082641 [Sorghum bicolor]|uniref:uncharacterized protein LOC8082641 n=1 Tax=Sorghum bicolor TaxID=4558 RepID=UPI000B4267F2|nr:uncharacterized protein LOC8082641 [Sorghum bicolor]|eukprot:XP_021306766.1 uncharacterized protein LOC8082641 [Sorghum bicolor]